MREDYYDDWIGYLDDEEKAVYAEIMEWERRPAKGGSFFHTLSAAVLGEIKKLSPEIIASTVDTVREVLNVLRDYSHFTIKEETIAYKISRKCSQRVVLDRSLEQIPVGILDEGARECINFNVGASCLSGGLTGAAGLSGLLIDLPVLYGLLFRIIQETAICYGYRIDTPEEKLYVLKILELGHIPEDSSRRGTITELHTLHTAIRGGVSLNQLGKSGLCRGIAEIAERIGLLYSRRKLMTTLMLLGGITGTAMNYLFAKEVSGAAFHTYRKRFIMDRAMARRLKRI